MLTHAAHCALRALALAILSTWNTAQCIACFLNTCRNLLKHSSRVFFFLHCYIYRHLTLYIAFLVAVGYRRIETSARPSATAVPSCLEPVLHARASVTVPWVSACRRLQTTIFWAVIRVVYSLFIEPLLSAQY